MRAIRLGARSSRSKNSTIHSSKNALGWPIRRASYPNAENFLMFDVRCSNLHALSPKIIRTDTVQVTGVGFSTPSFGVAYRLQGSVFRRRHSFRRAHEEIFQYGGGGYRRFFRPLAIGLETYVMLF